ncbi:MAG: hypothetical protein SF053_07560 [Bacteroidia bacterium]|nr:hypothetical protein [Bacteroidia bacterium]
MKTIWLSAALLAAALGLHAQTRNDNGVFYPGQAAEDTRDTQAAFLSAEEESLIAYRLSLRLTALEAQHGPPADDTPLVELAETSASAWVNEVMQAWEALESAENQLKLAREALKAHTEEADLLPDDEAADLLAEDHADALATLVQAEARAAALKEEAALRWITLIGQDETTETEAMAAPAARP